MVQELPEQNPRQNTHLMQPLFLSTLYKNNNFFIISKSNQTYHMQFHDSELRNTCIAFASQFRASGTLLLSRVHRV
jgi:hypothetical protein